MHQHNLAVRHEDTPHCHDHRHGHDHGHRHTHMIQDGKRATRIALAVTVLATGAEIVGGQIFNSAALLADGWHMAADGSALGIALVGYGLAARHFEHARSRQVLHRTALVSAILLGLSVVHIGREAYLSFNSPSPIDTGPALAIAIFGLSVNLICAKVLHHGHDHGDLNRQAAFLHIMADVLTSLTAIGALLVIRWKPDHQWLDPTVSLTGAGVIGFWAIGLARESLKGLRNIT
jgi:cation diffusion facilitator family transporter